MSSCFSLAERKPQMPAFAPARPAVQRKCACGGQCSSCRSKPNHGSRLGHNFGDINVHAVAEADFHGPVLPVRLAEIKNGETGCDASKGVPEIAIGQPSLCTRDCTQQHEEVHKADIGPCCKKANAAWTKATDEKGRKAVQDKMNDWVTANEFWLQCRAYAKSVSCADEFLQKNCSGKKADTPSSSPDVDQTYPPGAGDFPFEERVPAGDRDFRSPTLLAEDTPIADTQGSDKDAGEKPIDPERCCSTVKDYRFHANARRDAFCKQGKAPTPCPF